MSTFSESLRVEEVCSTLGLEHAQKTLEKEWEVSERSLPKPIPQFLNPSYIAQTCRDFKMSAEVANELGAVAEVIGSNRFLARLAWHAYWMAFEANIPWGGMSSWPSLKDAIGRPSDLFYAVVSLGALPKVKVALTNRGIPSEVIEATLGDLHVKLLFFKERHGELGLRPNVFDFQRRLYAGEMFQLGRLQFHFNPFRGRLRTYRRVLDGAVVALSEGGVEYRLDGEMFVPARGDDAQGTWQSSWSETESRVIGNPITPNGKVQPYTITLEKDAWYCELAPGDRVLQIHVPGSASLDFAVCGQSLEQALDFFPKHFVGRSFKAFVCGSWFLDDQIEGMLSPDSNLVRFQRELHRFPWYGNTDMVLHEVFGRVPSDLREAPQDTSLRRRVSAHVLAGGGFVGGAGFLLVKDFRWGAQVYRSENQAVCQESKARCK